MARRTCSPTQARPDAQGAQASRKPPLTFGDPEAIAIVKIVGRGADYRHRRALREQAGLHPTGFRLAGDTAPAGAKCGTCEHHLAIRRNVRRYHKCELLPDTHGPATDIRVSWPACEYWEEEAEPNDPERV